MKKNKIPLNVLMILLAVLVLPVSALPLSIYAVPVIPAVPAAFAVPVVPVVPVVPAAFAVPVVPAVPAPPVNFEKAVDLKILGLLANSPDDFQLDRAPTRLEGAIMLIRLLGKDKQVNKGRYEHPFMDVPGWARNYVGYMYQNKLTTGVGNSRFGSNDLLTAKQYVVFVLRSLGYRDEIDFSFGNVLDSAVEKGLLSAYKASALNDAGKFLRDDMVGISYNALSVKMRDSSQTLLDKLVTTDKAIFKPAAKILGLYTADLQGVLGGLASGDPPSSDGKAAGTNTDLFRLLRNAVYNNETKVTINIGGYSGDAARDFEKTLGRAVEAAETVSGVQDFVSSWEYLSSGDSLKLSFEYRYSKSEYNQRKNNYKSAVNKARDIAARRITAGMSDYDKEKVLHDYIVNNTAFDYKNYLRSTIPYASYDAYGCLVKGTAVCEGYTEAMKLLCDLSGIECIVVTGKASNNGVYDDHAWNIVRIDGEYCHVDLTSDDPVTDDGTNVLTYCYFNLTDNEMARSGAWNRKEYPICSSASNGYYYRSNKLANNRSDFDKAVLAALRKRSSIIEIKVMDYTQPKYSNLKDIMLKSGNVLKYRYTVNDNYGVIRIFNIQYT